MNQIVALASKVDQNRGQEKMDVASPGPIFMAWQPWRLGVQDRAE
ncbi:MAG: hypothetical protein AAFZ91_01605 [Pseudomonadota bacterium]